MKTYNKPKEIKNLHDHKNSYAKSSVIPFAFMEPKTDYDKEDTVGLLISHLMGYYEIFHRFHLNTKSYSKHMALDELYKGLPEYVDALAEVYLSLNKENKIFPCKDMIEPETDIEAVDCLIKEIDCIESCSRGINNSLDDLSSFLSGKLYKLQNLY